MKRSLTFFGLIILAQAVLCVPVPVEEPVVDPELRGLMDFILSTISRPIVNGISTGEKIIASTISTGENFLSSLIALGLNPGIAHNLNPELESQMPDVQDNDEMLDAFDALVDQLIFDPRIDTTETTDNGETVSPENGESGEAPTIPFYLVMLP